MRIWLYFFTPPQLLPASSVELTELTEWTEWTELTELTELGIINNSGREVQLRHIRGDKELPALVQDANYDVRYQEYRQFNKPVNVLPVRINNPPIIQYLHINNRIYNWIFFIIIIIEFIIEFFIKIIIF